MMIWALAEIEANCDTDKVEVVGMIHDALIAYVPENEVAYWAKEITSIMAHLPLKDLGWVPQLLFSADAEAGPDLAHLKKVAMA